MPVNLKLLGKADLHIHSDFSDGRNTINEIINYVTTKTDLNVIAITDHNTIEGALKAQKYVHKHNFNLNIIVGEEISTCEGHLIGLFLNKAIPPKLSLKETIHLIRQQNGLVLSPHPAYETRYHSSNDHNLSGIGLINLIKFKKDIDAVEVLNGTPIYMRYSNQITQFLNTTILIKSEIGSSDAHIVQAIGKSHTVFEGKTSKDLKKAILLGQTKASFQKWSLREVLIYAYFSIPNAYRVALYTLIHGKNPKRKILNFSFKNEK